VSFRPVDHEARERVRRDFTTSFVVEAGAGTGKTTLLVDRIEQLVRTGAAALTEIAAVTFTENAAATMKLRLRERLERTRADEGVPELERARSAQALDVLERAPISTIHALCASMLQERPLECGVPSRLPRGRRRRDGGALLAAWESGWPNASRRAIRSCSRPSTVASRSSPTIHSGTRVAARTRPRAFSSSGTSSLS
jgi:ATP-dependent exoDNAse (exonuclease V) beta subunit